MRKEAEKLKKIFLSEKADAWLHSRKDCPRPDDLILSFESEAPFELKKKIVDHVSQCPACLREFELIKASRLLIREVENKILLERTSLLNRLKLMLSGSPKILRPATASVFLLAVLSLIYFGSIYLKQIETERALDKSEILEMSEKFDFSAQPKLLLQWKSSSKALFYRVDIFDENMLFLWQSRPLTGNILLLPEDLAKILKEKQSFYWQLIIYSDDRTLIEYPVRKVKLSTQ